MRNDDYYVVVLLLAHNCLDTIGASIESVLSQSFDGSRIKLVAVDNNSTDGTYEALLNHTRKYDTSVYRLRETHLPTRFLRGAVSFLGPLDYKYMTILNPGDILYPDYIARCAATMDRYADIERGVLFCETDLMDENGVVSRQTPIFSGDCILLKREHYTQCFTNGVGHKIQCFFRRGAIPMALPELPFCIDHTDWFKKAVFSFHLQSIYLKDVLTCTRLTKYDDPIHDLILRLYLVKRLEATLGTTYSHTSYKYLNALDTERKIYENLSLLALRYASDALKRADAQTAGNILLFAEMVNEDIIGTKFYAALKKALASGKISESFHEFRVTAKSVPPPEGAIPINGNGYPNLDIGDSPAGRKMPAERVSLSRV